MTSNKNSDVEEAFTCEQYANVLVSGANTDFQLWIAPYANPAGKVGYIKELNVVNTVGLGCEVRFYDRDLNNTTPATRGSGSFLGCLMAVGAAAATTSGTGLSTVYPNIPTDTFMAGIVVQCSQTNARVMATIGVK